MTDKNSIRDAADAVRGVIESEPVRAAIMPAAQHVGRALGSVAEAVEVSLTPLQVYIWGWKRIRRWIQDSVIDKLEGIPPERIVIPAANVAGPVIEAMRFTADQPELREMYANLLATSMDRETASAAHPAFVEFVKQMTPDEARILTAVGMSVTFWKKVVGCGIDGTRVGPFLVGDPQPDLTVPELTGTAIDNLERMGLFTLSEAELGLPDPSIKAEDVRSAIASLKVLPGNSPAVYVNIISLTDLGNMFYQACVCRDSPE